MRSKTLTITINRPAEAVYDYVQNLANLPEWAASFCQSSQKIGDNWVIVTAKGPMKVRMTPRNDFGVLDHYVMPDPSVEIYVPMRVVENGEFACDVIFTLFQYAFTPSIENDMRMVEEDLKTLKYILEQKEGPHDLDRLP